MNCFPKIVNGFSWKIGDGTIGSFLYDRWLEKGLICDLIDHDINHEEILLTVNDVINQDNEWDLSKIKTTLPDDIISMIKGIPIPRNTSVPDTRVWNQNPNGKFT